jgi:DNA-binding CsgD family transcriptional regulator
LEFQILKVFDFIQNKAKNKNDTLKLLEKGKSANEIAKILEKTPRTIKNYIKELKAEKRL